MIRLNSDFRRPVFLFWALMDLLYLLWYSVNAVLDGNLPFYTDSVRIYAVLRAHGGMDALLYVLGVFVLNVSLFVSAILLFKRSNHAALFCYLQTPFRLLFVLPSISLATILVSMISIYQIVIIVTFLVFSELIKIGSLLLVTSNPSHDPDQP